MREKKKLCGTNIIILNNKQMLNIFRKQKPVTPIIEEPVTDNIVKEKIITSKDIQNDMISELIVSLNNNNSPSNKLDVFRENNKEIKSKAEMLQSLGFSNTPTAKKVFEIEREIFSDKLKADLEKTELDLISKYKIEYPGYKFVPNHIFNKVIEKYNLYTATPEHYKKEIPTKNLEEISSFINKYGIRYTIRQWVIGLLRGESLQVGEDYKSIDEAESELNHYSDNFNFFIQEEKNIEITAPLDHFDLRNSRVSGRDILKIEDPIVSRPVKGGRIIISVWDKEADIPEIKNEEWN